MDDGCRFLIACFQQSHTYARHVLDKLTQLQAEVGKNILIVGCNEVGYFALPSKYHLSLRR